MTNEKVFELKHINYALVEETRPPMYTAMKYWGKKPHNIWNQFIESYCPPGGIVLDPFAGSAISAFESVKAGRKSIAFDLNPLTSFIIEVLSSPFDKEAFIEAFSRITNSIESDSIYKEHYIKKLNDQNTTIYNYRWFSGKVVKVALETPDGKRLFLSADKEDIQKSEKINEIQIPFWYPDDKFPNTPSITHKFTLDIGGDGFQNLWTQRNLYLLSRIFHEINLEKDENVRKQLAFGFIQTLHLVSKMVVPRNEKSNRDFSGSWGRADYMIRRRSMEQNPLMVFKRSCIEKQGVMSALEDSSLSIPKGLKIVDVNKNRKLRLTADINYGIVDIADITNYISDKSIDFIITDPPYAGLVPYLDLSLVWLVWLQKLDKKYIPDLASEITIKKGHISREEYRRRLTNAFKQLHRVLKDDSYIVITFHHKKLQEWNDFVHAVKNAGFKFDKVTHQYNRRSGESNVANPYGTSGADFYIRCVKHRDVDFTDDQSGLAHFVTQKAIEIIAKRAEPTPYTFLISGLIPEMLQAGYMKPKEYQEEILRIISLHEGPNKIFKKILNNDNKSGDYWWFDNPEEHINYPDLPLKDRVEETVLSLLRRRVAVKLDDVLSELFRTYPNGLTPDPRGIKYVLEKYAYRSSDKWKMKDTVVLESTKHSLIIKELLYIGKKAGLTIFVGKREQPEQCGDGACLRDLADVHDLKKLEMKYDIEKIERIEMIDEIWLTESGDSIECVFEVENSTGFMSAIQRASNIEKNVIKFMIIPDEREEELLSLKDPLFVKSFIDNNWSYIKYDAVKRLAGYSRPSVNELLKIAKKIQ
jgi:DNA modification methylase/ribosomal protein S6